MSSIVERAQSDARFPRVLNRTAIKPFELIALHAAAMNAGPLGPNDEAGLTGLNGTEREL
jgi:hypothetical protein